MEGSFLTSSMRLRRAVKAASNCPRMTLILDEPPEMSFAGLFGSMMDSRSVFLYAKLETSFYYCQYTLVMHGCQLTFRMYPMGRLRETAFFLWSKVRP